MAKTLPSFHLPKRIANVFFKLQKVSKNLHQSTSSIGFIEKCLYHHITPKFAKINGQFLCEDDRQIAEQQLMVSHIAQHTEKLLRCQAEFDAAKEEVLICCGGFFGKLLLKKVENTLRRFIVTSLTTKNDKIRRLIINKVLCEERSKCPPPAPKKTVPEKKNEQPVPVINLSNTVLTADENDTLAYGLDHSFVDKNSHVKKTLAASLESVADRVAHLVDNNKKEDLHEFLRANTDIMTKNIYSSKDLTYSKLKTLVKDRNVAVIPGDKDSSVVVMNRADYLAKMQQMLDTGIDDGIYTPANDTTLSDLKKFSSFLYRNFKKCELYDRMTTSSNQPGQLYGIAKTHKFADLSEITVDSLKFRPIISQVGTCTYNAAQVISEYLKPLVNDNIFILNNTQDFASIIKDQPPLNADEEYVSYDVESLYTNVPLHDTINYILDEIYVKKKLPQLCTRRVFKNFLLKLTSESTFMFNDNFYRQINGCTMGGPLSVIMANIFMTKLELDLVVPHNPQFYKRYIDDMITRRKKNVPDLLLQKMSSYHPKINLTVELNPEKFLDTRLLISSTGTVKTKVYRKPNKLPLHWFSKTPIRYKRNAIIGDLHRSKRISSHYDDEVEIIKNKYLTAGFPFRFVNSVVDNFNNPRPFEDEDLPLIPDYFYEPPIPFILVDLPYSPENERQSKHFIKKLKSFLNTNCTIVIKWSTKKVRTLFSLKSKNPYPSCKIYEGACSCGSLYVGETKRNVAVRWAEHNDPRGSSEPSKHLYNFPSHQFSWRVLLNASQNIRIRKNLEASVIALQKPDLNSQVDSKKLTLFRYGVT